MILTRATRDGIRGDGVVSNGHVVQWVSLIGRWAVPPFHRHVPEGARLIVYLESGLDEAGYRDLLAGKHDAALDHLRLTLPADAIVRFDHEMDAPPNGWRTWGQMPPHLYVRVFWYVSKRLGCRLFWCPSGHHVAEMAAYFPGSVVSHVGFTRYDLGHRGQDGQRIVAARQWRAPLRELRRLAPDVPILIGETGTLEDDTGGRLRWLRSVKRVRGLWGVIYFDLDMTLAEGRDWTMTGAMRREWA